jgi:hypothetical protein
MAAAVSAMRLSLRLDAARIATLLNQVTASLNGVEAPAPVYPGRPPAIDPGAS